jgi:molybdate transport system substrate-binding protein
MRKSVGLFGLLLPVLTAHATGAAAAEVKVLCAVALQSAFEEIAREFQSSAGHTIVASYATAGVLQKRINDGETADVLILPRPAFEAVDRLGKISASTSVAVAQSTISMAVRASGPKPDISTPEAVKRALLDAKSIAYTDPAKGGASGVHFAQVLEQLGIAEAMKPKTILTSVPGPGPGDIVAANQAELAVSQTIDLLQVSGIDIVGPLPKELQNTANFVFLAGAFAATKEIDAANALLRHLRSAGASSVLKRKGMEPEL